jgi:hypothetical protein
MPNSSDGGQQISCDENRKVEGYSFKKDSYLNKMAFLFRDEEGEEEAARILAEAEEKYNNPLMFQEKKKFIEKSIDEWAAKKDKRREEVLKSFNFDEFEENSKTEEGRQKNDEMAVGLLKALGLNVDSKNVKTDFDAGPPRMIVIQFFIRPTENLTKPDSNINQLAKGYAGTLAGQEKQEFNTAWNKHKTLVNHVIPREEFVANTDARFQEIKSGTARTSNSKDNQGNNSSNPADDRVPLSPRSP